MRHSLAGADHIVVGRPSAKPHDPRAKAEEMQAEIGEFFAGNADSDMRAETLLRQIRWIVAFFIIGARPQRYNGLSSFARTGVTWTTLGDRPSSPCSEYSGLRLWIAAVWEALRFQNIQYPFLAYGTDWLAFGHLVIALFFVPAWCDPVRHREVFRVWPGSLRRRAGARDGVRSDSRRSQCTGG